MASIYTADAGTGLRYADAVRAAWVNVNESSNYWETHLPFGGGGGSASGVGRVGGGTPYRPCPRSGPSCSPVWPSSRLQVQELSMPSAVEMSWIACSSAGLTCLPPSRWAAATLSATVSTKRW
jgi:hypothetical protein